jgi:hypothetical protein
MNGDTLASWETWEAMAFLPFAPNWSKRGTNPGRDFDKLSPNGPTAR